MKPIFYTYEADCHCVDCTRERFPARPGFSCDANGVDENAVDREGNRVHATLETDELQTDLRDEDGGQPYITCGTCSDVIRERNIEALNY